MAVLVIAFVGAVSGQTLPLDPVPAWSALEAENSRYIAWGDVDGDGDLDLACANQGSPVRVYFNQDGQIVDVGRWSAPIVQQSVCLAWGDIDGDGDLDLVVANTNDRVRAYENVAGTLTGALLWEAQDISQTFSVALADFDDDGDLDLACGNRITANCVYRNDAGNLETTPSWETIDENLFNNKWTRSIAWGDMNGDGLLDLACGNDGDVNRVYLNYFGTLSGVAEWTATNSESTYNVAWGDFDGDGHLDLACANSTPPGTVNLPIYPVRVYRNEGTILEASPSWSSQQKRTSSVAWGDVDGDGDLDLACGLADEPVVVYLSDTGLLSGNPLPVSSITEPVETVAWGDVDGDGDLDLAVAGKPSNLRIYESVADELLSTYPDWRSNPNEYGEIVAWGDIDQDGGEDLIAGPASGSRSGVFRNVGKRFERSASWQFPDAGTTSSLAVGDLNGDGKLDVARARLQASIVVYLNGGQELEQAPIWNSGVTTDSWAVALAWGDVDGDGDLDLAVAGGELRSNRLYRNTNGTLEAEAIWNVAGGLDTRWVAWGDVDGDGDLDLACANNAGRDRVYFNTGAGLSETEFWAPARNERSTCVAWGDVDGDGDLDLAISHSDQAVRLYLNQDGVLERNPDWAAAIPSASTIAWGDVDGDGDLDLAASRGASLYVFLNAGTRLQEIAAWSAPFYLVDRGSFTRFAWGDMNGDGHLDLAAGSSAGNGDQVPSVYLNRHGRALASANDPLLVNNPTRLRRMRVERSQTEPNHFKIRFVAEDLEGDPFKLRAAFRFQGNATAIPMELIGESGSTIGPLESSAAGVEHELTWDILRLPVDPRAITLLLRVVEIPQHGGAILHSATLRKEVGRIVAKRPQLALEFQSFDFGTVCVGDSRVLPLTVRNSGQEQLDFGSVTLPSESEMSLSSFPSSLAPGASVESTLTLHPTSGSAVAGSILIPSNDPVVPVAEFSVQVVVQPLEFGVSRLNDQSPWPLAEAIPFLIEPSNPSVHIERGAVHYRRPGEQQFKSTPLQALGGNFSATISGENVSELGVEYYVEVENNGVFAFDPPGAPAELTFLPVAAPSGISTLALPNLGSSVAVGLDATISISLPEGAELANGQLFYRVGGAAGFDATAIEAGPPLRAVVPGSAISERGLEYYVELTTASGTQLSDPPSTPEATPRVVRVTAANIVETEWHPGGRYRLLSIPVDFPQEFTGSLQELLVDQGGLGSYHPNRWRAFVYSDGANVEFTPTDERFRPRPGRAFWLISRGQHRVDTAPIQGQSVDTATPFTMDLQPGWNQIGHPFAFPVAWADVEKSADIVDLTAYDSRVGEIGGYSEAEVTELQPFEGYFVYNTASQLSTIRIPATELSPALPEAKTASQAESRWSLGVHASSEVAMAKTVLGVSDDASEAYDPRDRRLAPPSPGAWLHLGSTIDGVASDSRALFARQFDAPAASHRWELVLRSDVGARTVTLDADLSELPSDMAVVLVDRETGSRTSLRDAARLELVSFGPGDDYRLTLFAGEPEAVEAQSAALIELPQAVVLDQNVPNPFNPSTRIRFGLPNATRVTLRIYNVRGELVHTLLDGQEQPAGYHSLVWNGEDSRGVRVASGVYLYRLETPELVMSRKLLLVE